MRSHAFRANSPERGTEETTHWPLHSPWFHGAMPTGACRGRRWHTARHLPYRQGSDHLMSAGAGLRSPVRGQYRERFL
ncbi:Hypothetical protein RMHFA_04243 [Roseomonas mucosa]|uniref:Uncharacterized protein n=1 Tax=Roseomonas mucosa TaxID=207340 RepID=A0A4Y1MX12_9PROT|nr:hypothetical protein RADP37_04243 [Roseomonas mucosa]QDD94559.1 hypothetical protein HVIM_04243 [Roseomonas mucosa]QDD99667.1 hypothetical protein ADP8_04243 [Roseomonas mucosa]UZO91960.1 Hypothetical protein RMP42_04243 [Roseomonas mucosa]UZO96705.1 Hypothetical protein RMHFA_04243 [Roseomonas mucosa]